MTGGLVFSVDKTILFKYKKFGIEVYLPAIKQRDV